MSEKPSRGLLFRWIRYLVVTILLGIGGCTGWLLRDPVAHIMSRRATEQHVTLHDTRTDPGHRNERLRITGANGLAFDLQLRFPIDSANTRRPVFIILGGYRTGDRAATLIPDTRGNIVVALSYPYDGDLGLKGLAVLPAIPKLRQAILDTPAAVMLALDYLLTRPDVDSSRVELVGASFGTAFGTFVGAVDGRVSRTWSVHGAARPYDQIELNLRRQIPWATVRVPIAALATLLASGWHLDPARWAPRIAPRPFVMINARDDERMPRPAIDALYARAVQPKELIWLDGPHVQSNRASVLASLVETVLTRASRP